MSLFDRISIIKSIPYPLLYSHEDNSHEDTANRSGDGCLAAIDIGTTTIAMVLYDVFGEELEDYTCVNPQRAFGADVLSRIRAAEDPKAAREMKEQVRHVLAEGLSRFLKKCKEKLTFSIAANTTMIYLLMGWDTSELGKSPFYPSKMHSAAYPEDFRLLLGGVPGVVLPGYSAFLGGDSAAGILALGMREREEITLLLDLGTNGEIILGNRHRIIGASTAAGPAFEGGATLGIWGTDRIALTARLLKEGIVDETGLIKEPWFEEGIQIEGVRFKQKDIRSLQLAKGAIAAGVTVLLDKYGIRDMSEVDQVVLAGGFGYFLQKEDAARIGLLPEALTVKVQTGGNVALMGAYRYGRLIGNRTDRQANQHLLSLYEEVEVVNLAEEKGFSEKFVSALNFPPV